MSDVFYQTIQPDEAGQRLDNYLFRILKGVPKSRIYRIIRSGEVRINKKRVKPDYRLAAEDLLRVPPVRVDAPAEHVLKPGKYHFNLDEAVIFENKQMLVVNKPAGLAVHGGSGIQFGLIEIIRQSRPDIPYVELVHRLDRETSGCLLLAKKRSMLRLLQEEIRERRVRKHYQALLLGKWHGHRQIEVKQPLIKNHLSSGERIVVIDPNGKPCHTTFRLMDNYAHACLVEAHLHTGRTHQIRVHSQFLKHPIIGDDKYNLKSMTGNDLPKARRLYLHASSISFTLDTKRYRFDAPVDHVFQQYINHLKTGDNDDE